MRTVFGGLRSACLVLSLFSLSFISTASFAQLGDLVAEYPGLNASKFVYDASRDRVYASITDQNQIAVIENQTNTMVALIPFGQGPVGLAISNDNNQLFVANSAAPSVEVLDLNTLQPVNMISTSFPVYDLVMDNNNILYATPAQDSGTGGIYQIDGNAGFVMTEFSGGVLVYRNGLLQISPDKNTLFFANVGISPGTLASFDLSSGFPTLIQRNPHGSLGGNGQDLELTADGQFISYATGGGNNLYDINKMNVSDFTSVGSFNTGPYPREIEYSPTGTEAFIVHEAANIDIFDANTFSQIGQIPTPTAQANELLFDASGNVIYAAHSDGIRVYAAINLITPITAVSFPDFAFQQCFDEQAQLNNWQFAEQVQTLDCSGRGINSIDGIEILTRLQTLDVSNNNIQNLNFFPQMLGQLRSLDISNNQLIDAYPLQSLTSLNRLYIGDNPLDIFSLGPVTQAMRGLTHLGLAGLPLQDLGMLQLFNPDIGQPYPMIELDLSRTDIVDSFMLTNWPTLQVLNISATRITSLGSLSQLSELRQINLAGLISIPMPEINQLVQNNPNLTHINLSGIPVQDLNQLPLFDPQIGMPYNLLSLEVADTGINNIDIVGSFPNLQVLDISGNDVATLFMLNGLTQLQKLDVSGNEEIPDFELMNLIQANPNLTHLGIADIRITDLGALPLFDINQGQPYNMIALNLRNTGINDIFTLNQFLNLEELDISDNNVVDLQPIRDLNRLRKLDISNNLVATAYDLPFVLENKPGLTELGIGGIPLDDLGQLPLWDFQTGQPYKMKVLRLQNTGVRDIYTLNSFLDLEELDLSGNNVVDIMPLMNMQNLRKLYLSGNNGIDGQVIYQVLNNKFRLTHLGLADIAFQGDAPLPLPPPVFFGIVELDLSNTGLETVQYLLDYPELRRLDISNNLITDINPLNTMVELRELDISYNRITDLYPLINLKNLTHLNVSGNTQIVDMNSVFVVVSNNSGLTSLSLSGLPLLDVNQLPFVNYASLRYLDISNTQVTNLGQIQLFQSLRELNISDNALNDFVPLQALSRLNSLDMSNVGATNLSALFNYTNLTRLNVSNNPAIPLGDINGILSSNPGISELEIAGINIGDLYQLQFYVGGPYPVSLLRTLDVSNTGISSVNRLSEMPGIRKLDISNNNLPGGLFGIEALTNLRDLNLASTGIYTPYDLSNLRFLENFDVSGNNANPGFVNELQVVMTNNPNIKSLGLANLGITDFSQVPLPIPVPGSYGPMNSLAELNLDDNPLENLFGFESQGSLKRVSLRNIAPATQGQYIALDPLKGLIDPYSIDLRDNSHFLCSQLDDLEFFWSPEVVQRPATCLQSLVPQLTILDPISPLTVDEGTLINFAAQASDVEDGPLTSQIQWLSSIDGAIGTGGGFQKALSAGNHVITATVTDSSNQQVSQSINITVNALTPVNYCSSKGNSTWYEWANGVELNGQVVTSGNNGGYSDNTATEFVVQRGGSYPITMTPGFRSYAYTERWAAWIDFNRDGEFTADERLFTGSSNTSLTLTGTIPVVAKSGKTRMRVVMRWGSTPSACGNYTWGETEDFTVNIQ